MAEVIGEQIIQTLREKYLLHHVPLKFTDLQDESILNIYARLLLTYDYVNEFPSVDHEGHYKYDCNADNLKHTIRCLRPLGLSYLAPKTKDLLDKKKASRIISALHDKISSKYGKTLPQRVRMVIKKEELLSKASQRRNINVIKPSEKSSAPEKIPPLVETEVFMQQDWLSTGLPGNPPKAPTKHAAPEKIVLTGWQIPRTPLKESPVRAPKSEPDCLPPLPPPPLFGDSPKALKAPPEEVPACAYLLTPPSQFADGGAQVNHAAEDKRRTYCVPKVLSSPGLPELATPKRDGPEQSFEGLVVTPPAEFVPGKPDDLALVLPPPHLRDEGFLMDTRTLGDSPEQVCSPADSAVDLVEDLSPSTNGQPVCGVEKFSDMTDDRRRTYCIPEPPIPFESDSRSKFSDTSERNRRTYCIPRPPASEFILKENYDELVESPSTSLSEEEDKESLIPIKTDNKPRLSYIEALKLDSSLNCSGVIPKGRELPRTPPSCLNPSDASLEIKVKEEVSSLREDSLSDSCSLPLHRKNLPVKSETEVREDSSSTPTRRVSLHKSPLAFDDSLEIFPTKRPHSEIEIPARKSIDTEAKKEEMNIGRTQELNGGDQCLLNGLNEVPNKCVANGFRTCHTREDPQQDIEVSEKTPELFPLPSEEDLPEVSCSSKAPSRDVDGISAIPHDNVKEKKSNLKAKPSKIRRETFLIVEEENPESLGDQEIIPESLEDKEIQEPEKIMKPPRNVTSRKTKEKRTTKRCQKNDEPEEVDNTDCNAGLGLRSDDDRLPDEHQGILETAPEDKIKARKGKVNGSLKESKLRRGTFVVVEGNDADKIEEEDVQEDGIKCINDAVHNGKQTVVNKDRSRKGGDKIEHNEDMAAKSGPERDTSIDQQIEETPPEDKRKARKGKVTKLRRETYLIVEEDESPKLFEIEDIQEEETTSLNDVEHKSKDRSRKGSKEVKAVDTKPSEDLGVRADTESGSGKDQQVEDGPPEDKRKGRKGKGTGNLKETKLRKTFLVVEEKQSAKLFEEEHIEEERKTKSLNDAEPKSKEPAANKDRSRKGNKKVKPIDTKPSENLDVRPDTEREISKDQQAEDNTSPEVNRKTRTGKQNLNPKAVEVGTEEKISKPSATELHSRIPRSKKPVESSKAKVETKGRSRVKRGDASNKAEKAEQPAPETNNYSKERNADVNERVDSAKTEFDSQEHDIPLSDKREKKAKPEKEKSLFQPVAMLKKLTSKRTQTKKQMSELFETKESANRPLEKYDIVDALDPENLENQDPHHGKKSKSLKKETALPEPLTKKSKSKAPKMIVEAEKKHRGAKKVSSKANGLDSSPPQPLRENVLRPSRRCKTQAKTAISEQLNDTN